MSNRSRSRNAFESNLSGALSAGASAIDIDSATGLTAPGYLVVEPEAPLKREYVHFSAIATNTLTGVTRGLDGSASGAQGHDAGAVIRAVPVHQHLDDIFDDIEANTTTIEGHKGAVSTADHPEATTGSRGFLSAADKTKLDAITTPLTESQISDLDHTDTDAVHVDTAAEFAGVTAKTTPVGADTVLIEDSEAANVKKRVVLSGLNLVTSGYRPDGEVLVLTGTATFDKGDHPGLRGIGVHLIGAGGQGGGAEATAGGESSVGHGGGGGGYTYRFYTVGELAASEPYTVGAGGTGAGAGASGNAGGTTSFATGKGYESNAPGGAGGAVVPAGTGRDSSNTPGAGGGPGTGDFTMKGSSGGTGLAMETGFVGSSYSGWGGAASRGGGVTRGTSSTGNGGNGNQYGGGGAGGMNGASDPARTGGVGAAGTIVVELFY